MTQTNHPGVVLPPPALYAGALILVLLLRWLWPLEVFPDRFAWPLGMTVLLLGIAFNAWGAYSMIKAKTPINPYLPTNTIVATGAFGVSRNPLYVSLDTIFVGLSLILNSLWGVLMLVPLLVVMHYGVIVREERYLEARFGEAYRQYCSKVRRYL
ncbi:MAG TPA: isoprenylcysteine carboxylmethyltransferase family protein [Candidatus Limnocylindrales bacterium]|nr:isoprenylcysteine carboxylmethyltransferase family protein [Candidatus Limnocylindrales bacterium]